MLENIKNLRNQARINKDSVARYAYEAVATECDTAIGRSKEQSLSDKKIIKIIKKEIGKYKEMTGKEREIELLSELLPEDKPQISEDKIRDLLSEYEGNKNPGLFMKWLNEQGYEDQYNKGLVAKIVLGR